MNQLSFGSAGFKEPWRKSVIKGDKRIVERLADRLRMAGSHSKYQRIQCVLLRAMLGSSAAQIAQSPRWSTATMHVVLSRWAQEGEAIFEVAGRGADGTAPHRGARDGVVDALHRAGRGCGMLAVADIQQASRDRTDKAVARSMVNGLLERHGWRKLVPPPRHPKTDVAAQAASKGTSPRGSPRGFAPG
jgi:Winged helix-turn helix